MAIPMTPHTEMLNDLLKLAVESGASDIVVKSNKPGYVRLSGRLKPVEMDPISCPEAQAFVDEHVPKVFKAKWEEEGQIDFAYSAEGVGRFRVNAFHQRGLVSIVLRHIKSRVPTFADLNITPEPMLKLAQAKDGILLICGATGSGKSSTMAAMLNWINQNMDKHIVTIEDPIEYTFQDEKSLFQQREIGLDVGSFQLAIRAVLRQNPDIILIGEMRDRETFETAISAAETGTWCSPPCTPRPWRNRSRASSSSSRPRNSCRHAAPSPVRCAVSSARSSFPRSRVAAASRPTRCSMPTPSSAT